MPTKRTDQALKLAREMPHDSAQRYPVTDSMFAIVHGADPLFTSRGQRTLAPQDLADEMPARWRRQLLDAVRGYGIGCVLHRKMRQIGLFKFVGKGRTVYRAPLTAYGRAVVWCLGGCTHDEVAAGPSYEKVNRQGERISHESEVCLKCGERRRVPRVSPDPWMTPERWTEAQATWSVVSTDDDALETLCDAHDAATGADSFSNDWKGAGAQ